jgi:hypothetical protein
VGEVRVENTGSITTAGSASHGILALSVAGDGGAAGDASLAIVSIGGSNPAATNGGSAGISSRNGTIVTSGETANGLLAQSIGGGGGTGGSVTGLTLVGIGGTGGGGGEGGAASVTMTGGSITTGGALSHGIEVQSLGGGGGAAGNATGLQIGFALTIGGSAGAGGNGGPASVVANGGGTIAVTGAKAQGILVQSVGGGGGSGGAAYASAISPLVATAVAVGGSGGSGGTGGAASVLLSDLTVTTGQTQSLTDPSTPTNLAPADMFGVHVQSIGGGGGSGGAATAQALALAVKIPETKISVAASVAVAVGGSGDAGGDGGPADASVGKGAIIMTSGMGSHGLFLQSIGGGGGNGGDSTALAAVLDYRRVPIPADFANKIKSLGDVSNALKDAKKFIGETVAVEVAVAVGGSAGVGGKGGSVSVDMQGGTDVPAGAATITTYGDYANAIMAQSIGGGGGDGGFGSTATAGYGVSTNFTVNVGLGASGGAGGAGGVIDMVLGEASGVATYGDGSTAISLQSIGGGGGSSKGGTIKLGVSGIDKVFDDITAALGSLPGGLKSHKERFDSYKNLIPKTNLSISIGAKGTDGGAGDLVDADIRGTIETYGNDSLGVLAQSIGGGGGEGGASGAEASPDNPIKPLNRARSFGKNIIEKKLPTEWTKEFTLALAIGGEGGQAAHGGQVLVSHAGAITTAGDWSHGIFTQSIGGGGGKGGTAAAKGSKFVPNIAINVLGAKGGSGGGGGNGGNVSLNLDGGAIETAGYAAFGALAQSIGGGGGFGADGSDVATGVISVGVAGGGAGGAGGNGGEVNAQGVVAVRTSGDVAHAVVLQSVGGSGGIAGAGASAMLATGVLSNATQLIEDFLVNQGLVEQIGFFGPLGLTFDLAVGGGAASSGTGGKVSFASRAGITTSGANAYGLVAQSVGGGGGIGFVQPGIPVSTIALGGHSSTSGNDGGSVVVTLQPDSKVTTTGFAAHAIVAQSIGGGGGIAGYPVPPGVTTASLTAGPPVFATNPTASSAAPKGHGGPVSVSTAGAITTTGDGAFGVLAQSIGGGGGISASGNAVTLGSTGSSAGQAGGAVKITQAGTLHASGANAVGIFAQSRGPGSNGVIEIEVNGSVAGGSGAQGYGVWVDGGNTLNKLTIGSGGQVSALSGQAIFAPPGNVLLVVNRGTVAGTVAIGNSTMINEGTYVTGQSVTATGLVNHGTLRVGPAGTFTKTTVSGEVAQGAGGVLVIDADFAGRRASLLAVQGRTELDGTVSPVASSILPGIALPFLTVSNGQVVGSLTGAASSIFTYSVTQATGSDGGAELRLTADADFHGITPSQPASRAAVAGYLQALWDSGTGGAEIGRLFALIGNAAASGRTQYAETLGRLSPDAGVAPGARNSVDTLAFATRSLSCPAFAGTTAMLIETRCSWMRVSGQRTNGSPGNGVSGFRMDSAWWQIGGQHEVSPGWFLDGSLAYESRWLSTNGGPVTGNGQNGYGSVVLKHQTGPWLFATVGFGGAGQFNTSRAIALPGFGAVAKGSPNLSSMGLLLRGAYTIGEEAFYLRPHLTFGTVHTRTGAYQESGAGALDLAVDSQARTSFVLNPGIEVGGRIPLTDDALIRPFLAAGVHLSSNTSWKQTARFASAPSTVPGFTTTINGDRVIAWVNAGVQLYTSRSIDLRLQYDGEYGATVTSHGGSFIGSVRF